MCNLIFEFILQCGKIHYMNESFVMGGKIIGSSNADIERENVDKT